MILERETNKIYGIIYVNPSQNITSWMKTMLHLTMPKLFWDVNYVPWSVSSDNASYIHSDGFLSASYHLLQAFIQIGNSYPLPKKFWRENLFKCCWGVFRLYSSCMHWKDCSFLLLVYKTALQFCRWFLNVHLYSHKMNRKCLVMTVTKVFWRWCHAQNADDSQSDYQDGKML